MAQGSINVIPGSPELAQSVAIELRGVEPNSRWELKLDRLTLATYSTDGRGNLTASFDADGHEVGLANFGSASAERPTRPLTRLAVRDYRHLLRLERI